MYTIILDLQWCVFVPDFHIQVPSSRRPWRSSYQNSARNRLPDQGVQEARNTLQSVHEQQSAAVHEMSYTDIIANLNHSPWFPLVFTDKFATFQRDWVNFRAWECYGLLLRTWVETPNQPGIAAVHQDVPPQFNTIRAHSLWFSLRLRSFWSSRPSYSPPLECGQSSRPSYSPGLWWG